MRVYLREHIDAYEISEEKTRKARIWVGIHLLEEIEHNGEIWLVQRGTRIGLPKKDWDIMIGKSTCEVR